MNRLFLALLALFAGLAAPVEAACNAAAAGAEIGAAFSHDPVEHADAADRPAWHGLALAPHAAASPSVFGAQAMVLAPAARIGVDRAIE